MKVVSVGQMQTIEKSADVNGLSYEAMMQNAGSSIAAWVSSNLRVDHGVIGLIGSGNNGGDTIIALSFLSRRGVRTLGFLAKSRDEDPLIEAYIKSGGSIVDVSHHENFDMLKGSMLPGTVVLDGILGTGLKLPIRSQFKKVMAEIKQVVESQPGVVVVAVDCPSGVDCDTGEASDEAINAKITLSMAAIKQGLLKPPGRLLAGEFHLMDIGIPDLSEFLSDQVPEMIDNNLTLPLFPDRPDDGHKGTFGTCLVLAGTQPYTGAAYLVGKAAYKSGCGLVNVATLETVQKALSGKLIEAVWTILPEARGSYAVEGVDGLNHVLEQVDSLVIGPGWGLSEGNQQFLDRLLRVLPEDLPTVFDADGLKLLGKIKNWWQRVPVNSILTPHPGEMSALTGLDTKEIQRDRWAFANRFSKEWQVTLLLKGAVSVISSPGGMLYLNPISDSALATAGSGDVLSGVIGGLLAQGMTTIDSAVLGVWLHSQAGVLAHKAAGTDVSVTALDILDHLGMTFANKK